MTMLHRMSRMKGFHVGAADGPMGHIDDFIVDESTWQTRYLVIDTSNWMGGKWVAVSPESVTDVDWANQSLKMNLTREEIRNSPSLEEANVPSHELTPRFVIL
jgi:hypothetical protein